MALAFAFLFGSNVSAQTPAADTQEELFSTQGTITEINAEEKYLRVKVEGGLELTFHVDDATAVQAGAETKSYADLLVDDLVSVSYLYNENYEKIAREITKHPRPTPTGPEALES